MTEFSKLIIRLKKLALDTLFPISCISCQRPNHWICKQCLLKVRFKKQQFCPICEETQSPDGKTCHKCRRKDSLDGLLVCLDYQENKFVKKAIHFFKYRFVQDLGEPLGKIMCQSVATSSIDIPNEIIPVPLHRKRLRWRGFNQSKILADIIGKKSIPNLEIPVSDILVRRKNTQSQATISNYRHRKENLKDAFSLSENVSVKGKKILLVDDISTTGATIFECAKVLKKNGAKKVFAIVLARPSMN